ncbi:MAG: hypothetical protein ACKN9T_11140, partial [Candidatus Methylumidiphilus sp.]
MSNKLAVHLLIIDPQVDFMDSPNSALPVPGANADMRRLAAMLHRVGNRLADIHVTLDSHRVIDIGHPGMWRDANGASPPPFTIISVADIETGIWRPRNEHAKLAELSGKSIGQYMLDYARALAAGGQYPLMVWPEHCLIGTSGHAVQADLMAALVEWERSEFANVDYVVKGTNSFTEHYGALMAEVPMATDPGTGLNTQFLNVLAQADIIAVAGEALSHCVMSTVNQIANNIGVDHIRKFHILTDCSSPVSAVPNGPDFPALA